MKKLKSILNKEEFETVRKIIEKEAKKESKSFISYMANLRFKCLLEGIGNVKDPTSLFQIKILLDKKNPEISNKLNRYIKKTFSKNTTPF